MADVPRLHFLDGRDNYMCFGADTQTCADVCYLHPQPRDTLEPFAGEARGSICGSHRCVACHGNM